VIVVLCLCFLASCGRNSGSEHVAADRPNVVLISVDTLRPDHLGCYGYARATSPTIDRLAAEGTLFEVAISSSSWTLPAHAALFTGLPDSVHGADRGSRKLEPERRTLAEAIRAAGYRTLGIWTGPLLAPKFGFAQGFDRYVSHEDGTDADLFDSEKYRDEWEAVSEKAQRVVTGPDIEDRIRDLIVAPMEQPFFLFVHLWDVHYDYIPPAPFDTLFDSAYAGGVDGRNLTELLRWGPEDIDPRDLDHLKALYDGEIASTDRQVQFIVDRLHDLGFADETLIILTADHGEEFFEHGLFGHKRALYDESIRIPLVFWYPGHVPAGQRIEKPVRIIDIAPTILEFVGAVGLPDILGRSLLSEILQPGGSPPSPAAISQLTIDQKTGAGLLAIRTADWKLVTGPNPDDVVGLWDLKNDPFEQDNVYGRDETLTSLSKDVMRQSLLELHRLQEKHVVAAGESDDLDDQTRAMLENLGYLVETPNRSDTVVFHAEPNPIRVCDSTGLGVTTLSWDVPELGGPVEVRVSSPDGALFAQSPRTGSATTGKWAGNGLRFFLIEQHTGEVLAEEIVFVTHAGCLDE
jgi:arylsulfatase A-like enzyme